jgi:hypothetical protein
VEPGAPTFRRLSTASPPIRNHTRLGSVDHLNIEISVIRDECLYMTETAAALEKEALALPQIQLLYARL